MGKHKTLLTNKRTAVSLVLALGLVIGVGVSTVNRAAISPVQRTDFTVYQLAGKAVIDGTDIYQVRNVRGWAYVYPPPFAILMAPFALLSVFWGALVWYLISVALIVWALVMCVRTVRSVFPVEDRVLILSIVPIILLLVWLMSGLARGQASVLLMWLVLAAFCWHWEGHDLRHPVEGLPAGLACIFRVEMEMEVPAGHAGDPRRRRFDSPRCRVRFQKKYRVLGELGTDHCPTGTRDGKPKGAERTE
jgi:hypothetical protein